MFHFSQEYYTMYPVIFYFPKNSYLVKNFNRKLVDFEASGLIKFWASTHMDFKYLNVKAATVGPKQLTPEHLSGMIQLLIGGEILASLVFVLELFWDKIGTQKIVKYLLRRLQ